MRIVLSVLIMTVVAKLAIPTPVQAGEKKFRYIFVSKGREVVQAKKSKIGRILFADADPKKVLEWAMIIEEVVVYGEHSKQKLVRIHQYSPRNRRSTQKRYIPDSKGTVCKKKEVVKRKVKKWVQSVDISGLPSSLPRLTVKVKLAALFADNTKELVIDETYNLDL